MKIFACLVHLSITRHSRRRDRESLPAVTWLGWLHKLVWSLNGPVMKGQGWRSLCLVGGGCDKTGWLRGCVAAYPSVCLGVPVNATYARCDASYRQWQERL